MTKQNEIKEQDNKEEIQSTNAYSHTFVTVLYKSSETVSYKILYIFSLI